MQELNWTAAEHVGRGQTGRTGCSEVARWSNTGIAKDLFALYQRILHVVQAKYRLWIATRSIRGCRS